MTMEEIYPPENYGSSVQCSLKQYFEIIRNIVSPEASLMTQIDGEINETDYLLAIQVLMASNTSYNDIKHLSKICHVDLLTCDSEDTNKYPMEVPENINSSSKLPSPFIVTEPDSLFTNRCRLDLESHKNPSQLCLGNKRNYHKRLDFTIPATPPDLEVGSDYIISVLIYKPLAFKFFNAKNSSEKLRFNHEILAIGQNTLEELRDTIVCSSDFGLCKEVESTSTNLRPLADARSIYPSGFLFIDNVFYNDFRDTNAIDYSFSIMEWAKEKKIKNLQSKTMDSVTINSLTPRFGYPYLYMHQGDCEHLLVFASAKLLDANDCLHSRCYPHVLKINRNANRMCFMCTVSFAKWICIGSNRLPQHKVFLCTDCCNAYNYVDGEKLGHFKLYPYYEKHVVI